MIALLTVRTQREQPHAFDGWPYEAFNGFAALLCTSCRLIYKALDARVQDIEKKRTFFFLCLVEGS